MKIALEEMYKLRFQLIGVMLVGFGAVFIVERHFVPVLMGNLLGIIVAFVEMMLLGHSTETAISRNEKQAISGMVSGYFFRMALIAVLFYATTKVDTISTIGYVLPLFYPRIAIYLSALKCKKGGE